MSFFVYFLSFFIVLCVAEVHVSKDTPDFWLKGTGLAITFSCNLESGGVPKIGVDPASNAMKDMSSWLATHNQHDYLSLTWYEYGIHEGIGRLLNLWDEFGIKVSSYMVGEAVLKSPKLAQEIVRRGHEPVAHGISWSRQFEMTREQERDFLAQGIDAIVKVTGVKPTGFNAYWMEDSMYTLGLLKELGFTYHVDDLSRDIPFTKLVDGVPFAVVPYTLRCNDIELIAVRGFSSQEFYQQLVDEFDQLYEESKTRRRIMSISSHDRIGGTPAIVTAYRKFLRYVVGHDNVWFARKDWLASWALQNGPHYSCNATDYVCLASSCTSGCPVPDW